MEQSPGPDLPCDGGSSLVYREGWGSSSEHLCPASSMPERVGIHLGLSPQPWERSRPTCKASHPSGLAQHLTCHCITKWWPRTQAGAGVAEGAGVGTPWSCPELTWGQVQRGAHASPCPTLSWQSRSDSHLATPAPPTQSSSSSGSPVSCTPLQPAGLRGFYLGSGDTRRAQAWLCKGERPDRGGWRLES